MSDPRNQLPTFDEVSAKSTMNGKLPSFDDMLTQEQPIKKKASVGIENLQAGAENTPQSKSLFGATPIVDYREGLQPQQFPVSKKPAIYDIADLAKKHQSDDAMVLAAALPKSGVPGIPDIGTQNEGLDKEVLAGNPEAITSVISREQQRLQKDRDEISANLKGFTSSQGYSGALMNETTSKLQSELATIRKQQQDLLGKGIKVLNDVYAKKLLDSPDKSDQVQNTLGEELRSQKAKIGADLTYKDQKGIADINKNKPVQKSTISATDLDKLGLTTKTTASKLPAYIDKVNEISNTTKQELEYHNRDSILEAAQQRLSDNFKETNENPNTQNDYEAFYKIANERNYIEAQRANLINQYPQYKRELQKNEVAELWAERIRSKEKGELGQVEELTGGRDLLSGRTLTSDEDIKAVVELSKKTNNPLTEEEVRRDAENARVPSFAGNLLRGFGGSFVETVQGFNRITDSKTNADIANKELEGYKYRTPEALQGFSGINNIMSSMFSGIGNLSGLVVQTSIGGELFAGATGLSKLAALANTELKALSTASEVLPASRFGDMLVDFGVGETRGEALSNVINLANKGKHMGGTYGAIYAPSYEAAYQEASRHTADEDKRNEYASQVATANGVAMLVLNPTNLAGKVLKGVPKEEVMANFLKNGVPYGTKDIVKARLAELGNTFGVAIPASLIPLAQETTSKENIFGIHTTAAEFTKEAFNRVLGMTLAVVPFGVLGQFKIPTSEFSKSAMFEVGKQPELIKSQIEESYTKGDITSEEKNRQLSVVNTLADLVTTVPEKNNAGKLLTETEKNNLVYLQLQHDALVQKLETSSKSMKPSYEKDISEHQKSIDEIMGAKEEVPEQKTELTTGEKPISTATEEPIFRTQEEIDKLLKPVDEQGKPFNPIPSISKQIVPRDIYDPVLDKPKMNYREVKTRAELLTELLVNCL